MESAVISPPQKISTTPGWEMYNLVKELFPICRSITGDGFRQTLHALESYIPIKKYDVPSGTKVFDWVVPKEWNIKDAFIADESGKKIVDFKKNNLHVLGYSIPIDKHVSLAELQKHLYSLEDQPDAIPYATSYYQERWGFCLSHRERLKLKEGNFHVVIKSKLKDGHLTYAECIIPGKSKKEVFLSTYLCHPSMANNELSGPVVTTFLTKWIMSRPRNYTYRIVFIPETIGSITYLSRNYKKMKKNIVAGFNVTCVGDDRAYSYLPSRNEHTLADRVALHVLRNKHPKFLKYSYLDRGSDERQYCSPGIDLPVASVMRSKYGTFPEYHTSLDNLDFVTASGLEGTYDVLKTCIDLIERNHNYRVTCLGEPQLGKRGLYPNVSTKKSWDGIAHMMDFLAYADGSMDLIEIADRINVAAWKLFPIIDQLQSAGLVSI